MYIVNMLYAFCHYFIKLAFFHVMQYWFLMARMSVSIFIFYLFLKFSLQLCTAW